MSVDPDWEDIRREEVALLAKCKKFVLGSADSPGGGAKDILYFTPCGRWLRICARIAYYSRIDAGEGELSFQINSCMAGQLFDRHGRSRPSELDQTPKDRDDQLGERWGDLRESIRALGGTLAPNLADDLAESTIESAINRNGLLEQLKEWAKHWEGGLPTASPEFPDDSGPGVPKIMTPESLSGPEHKILLTLRQHGQRLTRTKVIDIMHKQKDHPCESTIGNALAHLMRIGLLDNDQSSNPKGFGLTEAGRTLDLRPR